MSNLLHRCHNHCNLIECQTAHLHKIYAVAWAWECLTTCNTHRTFKVNARCRHTHHTFKVIITCTHCTFKVTSRHNLYTFCMTWPSTMYVVCIILYTHHMTICTYIIYRCWNYCRNFDSISTIISTRLIENSTPMLLKFRWLLLVVYIHVNTRLAHIRS